MKILIVSGPTREPLDAVRYISNYSTGTLGKYLAAAAKKRGHRVTCIECPTQAETARELKNLLRTLAPRHEVLIMPAAVCDVRPAKVAADKIKKNKLSTISLVKNPDVLAGLAKNKKPGQIFIGFALESSKILKNGFGKLQNKNLDFIVVQKVTSKVRPFGDKPIEATILRRDGQIKHHKAISKKKLSENLIKEAEKAFFD